MSPLMNTAAGLIDFSSLEPNVGEAEIPNKT